MDWQQSQDYSSALEYSASLWAWQFLRRNLDYQRDWRVFWSTWQALESDYGVPPNRDFSRWKQDLRAYAPQGECDPLQEEAGFGCAGEGGKLLIECWLGAKWGFYKFPLDPDYVEPRVPEELLWREVELTLPSLSAATAGEFLDRPSRIAFGFDLALPLKQQLELAKQQLIQQKRQRRAEIEAQSVAAQAPRWITMLQLLDGLAAGADDAAITAALGLTAEMLAALRQQAQRLVAGGYRQILLLAEK